MHDELDLDGVTLQDAKAYVARYIATHKSTERRLHELREEFSRWEKRVELAQSKGESELAREALKRAEAAGTEFQKLKAEEKELAITCDLLKQRLETLSRRPELSVDADELLARLQDMIDP